MGRKKREEEEEMGREQMWKREGRLSNKNGTGGQTEGRRRRRKENTQSSRG